MLSGAGVQRSGTLAESKHPYLGQLLWAATASLDGSDAPWTTPISNQPWIFPANLLRDADFGVSPVHLPQRLTNLTPSRIGPYRIDDVGHRIRRGDVAIGSALRFLGRGFLQGIQCALDFVVRAACAQVPQLGSL